MDVDLDTYLCAIDQRTRSAVFAGLNEIGHRAGENKVVLSQSHCASLVRAIEAYEFDAVLQVTNERSTLHDQIRSDLRAIERVRSLASLGEGQLGMAEDFLAYASQDEIEDFCRQDAARVACFEQVLDRIELERRSLLEATGDNHFARKTSENLARGNLITRLATWYATFRGTSLDSLTFSENRGPNCEPMRFVMAILEEMFGVGEISEKTVVRQLRRKKD